MGTIYLLALKMGEPRLTHPSILCQLLYHLPNFKLKNKKGELPSSPFFSYSLNHD